MQLRSRIGFLSFSLALALAWPTSPAWAEEKQPAEAKVAVVNGSVITQEDFEGELSRVQQMFLRQGKPLSASQLSGIKGEVLESLINRELLYQESQKRGIEVDQSAVDERMSTLRKQFPSEAEFKRVMSQMNLTEDGLKSQIEREMAIQKLIDGEIAGKVNVSEEEIKSYYDDHPNVFKQPEQVRASHILIKVDAQAESSQKTEARKRIEKIQERIENGEDFATLATEFSEGPSRVRGGDLDYFRRGQMVKPFEDAAFALQPGEVSDVVETRFGYHLIKVTDRKPETTIAYKDIKGRIQEFLKRGKIEEETKQYVAMLKKEAQVETFLELEP